MCVCVCEQSSHEQSLSKYCSQYCKYCLSKYCSHEQSLSKYCLIIIGALHFSNCCVFLCLFIERVEFLLKK